VTYDVPTQIDYELGKKIEAVAKMIGDTGLLIEIGTFVINIFFGGFLQVLLNQIQKLNIMLHTCIVNLPIPANALIFFSYLL